MKWEDWKPMYNAIAASLGLVPDEDRRATRILSSLLKGQDTDQLVLDMDSLIRGNQVVICGAGPSLEEHLETIEKQQNVQDMVFIAADGATSALLERGIQGDIIVTDLDGDLNDIIAATNQGSICVVHAHGDNLEVVKKMIPKLGTVLGSTQVEPQPHVYLWGGFTDGDRACYLATHYEPYRLILAGMDFGDIVGKWSKPQYDQHRMASERKRKKLDIAECLLHALWKLTDVKYERMR